MTKWLRRVGGAVLTGIAWAALWAPVAVLVGLAVDPDGSMDEMWVAIGAYPGFLCGVVFSALLALAAGRRRSEELSPARCAAFGAISGLVVGMLPFAVGASNPELPPWAGVVILGSITLLSAISGFGTALVLQYLARAQAAVVAGPTR